MSTQVNNGQMRFKDLCFIDIETTGSIFGYHEIIDIAVIRTSADGLIERASWHAQIMPVYPERFSAFAKELTGYSLKRWSSAREGTSHLWLEFVRFAEGCVPVCHNPSFERAFITLAALAYGVEEIGLDYHWIGTESLAWPIYRSGAIPKLSLAALCDHFGIKQEPMPHSAAGGALACRRVYIELMKVMSERSLPEHEVPFV